MASDAPSKAESCEFTTDAGRKLELMGVLESWDDELPTGMAEHLILKRAGALHQDQGRPPRKFAFKVTLLGADCRARYNEIAAAIDEQPSGQLVHPRLGIMPAVCDGITAQESPGNELDAIALTLRFKEDGLRGPLTPSPTGSAQAAADAAAQTVTAAATAPPAVQAQAARFQDAVGHVQQVAADVQGGGRTVLDLNAAVVALRASLDGLSPRIEHYRVRATATIAYGHALDAYNAVIAGRPPIVPYRVPGRMSVARLAASLYPGKFARAQAAEILALNAIPVPYNLEPGTVVLLSDPGAVIRGGS